MGAEFFTRSKQAAGTSARAEAKPTRKKWQARLWRLIFGACWLGMPLATLPAPELPAASHRAELHLALAVRYFEAGQDSVALEEVEVALQANPKNAEAHSLRGLIEWRLHHGPAAAASFQAALSLQPNNLTVLQNAAWWQCQQGQADAARPYFEAALAQTEGDAALRLWAGQAACQQQARQTVAAKASYLRVLHLAEPTPPAQGGTQWARRRWVWEAQRGLAEIMVDDGEFEAARPYVRQVNQAVWADASTLWLGVRVERGLGVADADDAWWLQLQRQFPETPAPAQPF